MPSHSAHFDAEHKASGASLLMIVASVLLSAACLLIVFRAFFVSKFDMTLSDPVDGRFCVAILEHWYQVFQSKSSLTSPPFFYPERDVLGYSDAFSLYVPVYSLSRVIGCDPYLALEVTIMGFTVLGFGAMLYLLRTVLNFSRVAALMGASLFVCLNAYYIHLVHPHLASVVIIPVLWSLFAKSQTMHSKPLATLYLCACGIVLGGLLFTSFYIGWFTIVAALFFALSYLTLQCITEGTLGPVNRVAKGLLAQRSTIAVATVAFLVSLIPFMVVYLPALKRTGIRPWGYTLSFMTQPLGVFDVGRQNLIWGRLAGIIEDIISPGGIHEHPTGWAPITILFFVGTAIWSARSLQKHRTAALSERRPLLLALATALTCINLWFSTVRLGSKFTLWWMFWKFAPGGSAIRIPPRMNLVLNVGIVVVCMFGMEALRRSAIRYGARGYVVMVLLIAGVFVEQINTMRTHLVSRSAEHRRFALITKPPATCHEFYVSTWTDHRPSMLQFQVDAMFIADEFHVPTIDGYSSWFPKDWDLLSGTRSRIAADASDWAQRHNLTNLCSLDIDSGSWSTVSAASSIDLGQRLLAGITNPGFENGSMVPWVAFQLVAALTAQHAHEGAYSIAEESGDGSVYQDIKELHPGDTYTVSAWASGSPGCTATAQIAIFDPGSNQANFSSSRIPGRQWERLTESVTVSRAGTVRLHLFRGQGSGTIYWDDIAIYRETK